MKNIYKNMVEFRNHYNKALRVINSCETYYQASCAERYIHLLVSMYSTNRNGIFEFDSDPCKFLRNLVHPLKLESVEVKGDDIIVKDSNRQTKSLLIGRGGKNLSYYKEVVSRYFPHEIKVE